MKRVCYGQTCLGNADSFSAELLRDLSVSVAPQAFVTSSSGFFWKYLRETVAFGTYHWDCSALRYLVLAVLSIQNVLLLEIFPLSTVALTVERYRALGTT